MDIFDKIRIERLKRQLQQNEILRYKISRIREQLLKAKCDFDIMNGSVDIHPYWYVEPFLATLTPADIHRKYDELQRI